MPLKTNHFLFPLASTWLFGFSAVVNGESVKVLVYSVFFGLALGFLSRDASSPAMRVYKGVYKTFLNTFALTFQNTGRTLPSELILPVMILVSELEFLTLTRI